MGTSNPQDPIFVRSRTGFVVTFFSCPLFWVSKIQIDISLSTLNYEYVALSHSVRYLLLYKNLIKKVIENLGMDSDNLKFVPSSTFDEENKGAIVL